MNKKIIQIETSTDYIVNKCKLIGDLHYEATFKSYKHISPKFSMFSNNLKDKLDENNYVELKFSILSTSLMEIIPYEEASLNLMYQGFYNPAVALLRNCLEIFLTHIFYHIKTDSDIYLNPQTTVDDENKSYFEWKSGGRYEKFENILKLLKEESKDFNLVPRIRTIYKKLSLFVHGRENINSNGMMVGHLTNYFYSDKNILKYKEFHDEIIFLINEILNEYCKNYLK